MQPDLLTHPKFLLLERDLGPEHGRDALKCILRLWAHCQVNQRGEDWGKITADYVEMVCEWRGEPGMLYKTLLKAILPGRQGFAEIRGGRFVVHDWETHNSFTVANWRRNLKSRPAKAMATPREDHGPTMATPRPTRGRIQGPPHSDKIDKIEESELGARSPGPSDNGSESENAHIPTWEEFRDAFMVDAIPEEWLRDQFDWWNNNHAWLTAAQRLKKWPNIVRGFWAKDRAKWQSKKTAAPSNNAALEAIDAELQWNRDPDRRAELKKQRDKLTAA